MPFITKNVNSSFNLAKTANSPFHERFGAEMYKSNKKNIYASGKDTPTKAMAQPAPKSYSAVIDDDESSEGVSSEYVKSEMQTVEMNSSKEKEETVDITLNFNSDSVINGIILSEILGKPISKRKSRW